MANVNIVPAAGAALATGGAPGQSWTVTPAGPPALPTVPVIGITPPTGGLHVSGYRLPPTPTTQSPLTDALLRAAFFRAAGLFEIPGLTSLGVDQPAAVLWDSSLGVPAGPVLSVAGRAWHSVSVVNLDSSDVIQVRSSPDGVNWHQITAGLDALAANGTTQFQGAFRFLRAVRTAGNGYGTQVLLTSFAP